MLIDGVGNCSWQALEVGGWTWRLFFLERWALVHDDM